MLLASVSGLARDTVPIAMRTAAHMPSHRTAVACVSFVPRSLLGWKKSTAKLASVALDQRATGLIWTATNALMSDRDSLIYALSMHESKYSGCPFDPPRPGLAVS